MKGEIVNCDSMQMIRELEIGTAKPGTGERASVPHHLFDAISLADVYSAGRYMEDGRRVCRDIRARGAVPIVTGGTGLYLRALLHGIFAGPARSEEIRRRLKRIAEGKGLPYLHRWLARKDPEAADRIMERDRVRLIRALEVHLAAGRPMSEMLGGEKPISGFLVIKIGLNPDRDLLYRRINRKVEQMFNSGLLEETRRLLEAGYAESCKGFQALGYRYAIQVIRGSMDENRALELTRRDTRRYAKRQMTWFRKEEGISWIRDFGDSENAYKEAVKIIDEDLVR